jgi:hypothetical protein
VPHGTGRCTEVWVNRGNVCYVYSLITLRKELRELLPYTWCVPPTITTSSTRPPHHRIQEERGAERLQRGERKRKDDPTRNSTSVRSFLFKGIILSLPTVTCRRSSHRHRPLEIASVGVVLGLSRRASAAEKKITERGGTSPPLPHHCSVVPNVSIVPVYLDLLYCIYST